MEPDEPSGSADADAGRTVRAVRAVRAVRVRRRRLPGALRVLPFVLLPVILLVVTVALTQLILGQARSLQGQVRFAQDLVDANVRTLSQVQRELLRLQGQLNSGEGNPDVLLLQRSLVAQRVDEATLSYQAKTLGAEDLLARCRVLAEVWRRDVDPLVRRIAADPLDDDTALRADAVDRIRRMELSFNTLVSDGEINRKQRASAANATTTDLLDGARRLAWVMLVSLVGFVLLIAVAAATAYRFHRQRERATADLLALDAEARKLSLVASSTGNAVIITDADGHIEWVNQAYAELTGYTPEESIGHRPGDLLQGPDTDPVTVRQMRERLVRAEAFTCEVLNYAKDGRAYWVAIEIQPVHDDRGRLTNFIALETDVTRRRQSEEHLRRAKEAAEESAAQKSTFLASMSHEIRTPLNSVLGFTGLLLETELSEQQREFVETAHSSGNLLLSVINDILNFSSLESGAVELEKRDFDLARMVGDTLAMFRPESARRGLHLDSSLGDGLPPVLRGDEMRLRQALVNLLGNACKFTAEGGVSLEVTGRPVEGETGCRRWQLELAVHDTGIGVPAQRLDRLFQPFSQVDASTTRRYGGTGLGLAISRLILEQMGGRITVDSEVGVGSTFTCHVVLDEGEMAALPKGTDPQDDEPLPPLRVLLAEDDAINQMLARHLLAGMGQVPDIVCDGVEAVAAARARPYDLVLLDMHMPRMDGVEAARRIAADDAHGNAPLLVAVTASALAGDRERFLAAGLHAYVGKPVQPEELRAVVRRAARARAADAEAAPAATPGAPHAVIPAQAAPPGQESPIAQPEMAQPSAVDVADFLDRFGEDQEDLLDLVVDMFLAECDSRVAALETALDAADATTLTEVAHAFKGAAAGISASAIADACLVLERAGRRAELPADRAALDAVRAGVDAVRRWRADRQASSRG